MKQPEYGPGITPLQDKDYLNIFSFKLGLYPFLLLHDIQGRPEICCTYAVWASQEMCLGYAFISFFRLHQPAPGWTRNPRCLATGESEHHERPETDSCGDDQSDGFHRTSSWFWF